MFQEKRDFFKKRFSDEVNFNDFFKFKYLNFKNTLKLWTSEKLRNLKTTTAISLPFNRLNYSTKDFFIAKRGSQNNIPINSLRMQLKGTPQQNTPLYSALKLISINFSPLSKLLFLQQHTCMLKLNQIFPFI